MISFWLDKRKTLHSYYSFWSNNLLSDGSVDLLSLIWLNCAIGYEVKIGVEFLNKGFKI